MLHLVLFIAYFVHNPAKHLKPPKLVEFVSLKQIMHRNIFIPTLFTEMLVVNIVINDHQHTPKLKSLLVPEQSLDLGSVDQELHQC